MLYTSSHTRTSNTQWVETSRVNILWPDVSCSVDLYMITGADKSVVASGAAATIVSDALMNPFDGAPYRTQLKNLY